MPHSRTLSTYIVELMKASPERLNQMDLDKVAQHYGISREWAAEYRSREIQRRRAGA